MVRRIDYALARNTFVFTGLWFVIGAIVLWSPVPGALGIGAELFAVWLVLFFVALASSGSLLTVASLNAIFPVRRQTHPGQGRVASQPARWPGDASAPQPSPRHAQRES
jgi:hypothetical protein